MINKFTLNARHRTLRSEIAENAAITHTVNWAAELDTDTISSSTWTSEASGVTIANQANTTTTTSCRLSGSIGIYRVVNKVVLASGDTQERYIFLRVLDNSRYYYPDFGFWYGQTI